MVLSCSTLQNALFVAAAQYDEDSKTSLAAGQVRLSETFTQQAAEARRISEQLENALDGIHFRMRRETRATITLED